MTDRDSPTLPPSPRPSIRVRASRAAGVWGPPVLVAGITALGTVLAAWLTGVGKVELDSTTKIRLESLPQIAADVAEVKSDVKALSGKREADRERDLDRRREVDSELARHQQQIDALKDRRYGMR